MLGSVVSVRHLLLAASLAAVGIGLALAVLIGRGISRPIMELTRATQRLAEGDLSMDIPALDRMDEIGRMAQALLVFRRRKVAPLDQGIRGGVNTTACRLLGRCGARACATNGIAPLIGTVLCANCLTHRSRMSFDATMAGKQGAMPILRGSRGRRPAQEGAVLMRQDRRQG